MQNFRLYNASAGAGKTYQLVYDYLSLCLRFDQDAYFKSILAITFTKKAAQEMKQRVLNNLDGLARKEAKLTGLATTLAEDLKLEPDELAARAGRVLRQILHQYSAFSISTIDAFTNRIIRSFARDLKVNAQYEVEMDSEKILSEALTRFIADLKKDDEITRLLVQFLIYQLEDGRSPHLRHNLLAFSQNLLDENAQPFLQKAAHLKAADFLRIASFIGQEISKIESHCEEEALQLRDFFLQHQLEADDFSGKYFYKQCERVWQGNIQPFTSTVKKMLSGEATFHAKSKKDKAAKIEPLSAELRQLGLALDYAIEKSFGRYHYLKRIYSQLFGLAVLTSVDAKMQELKEDRGVLPIGEFNKIISEHLRNQPVAFIYEKLGERYRHFFIDEFQDTSRLQWENLQPLLEEGLARGGSVMLVGDPKQAIYRWRGGDVRQIIALSETSDQKIKHLRLPNNWRSGQQIVAFNNELFAHAAKTLSEPSLQLIYQQARQNARQKFGGKVDLHFLEKDGSAADFATEQAEYCLKLIKEARQKGYQWGDIAVIARNNEQVNHLAQALIEAEVPVISFDSLQIDHHPAVRAFVEFMRCLHQPWNQEAQVAWATFIYQHLKLTDDQHLYLKSWLSKDRPTLVKSLQNWLDQWNDQYFLSLGLSEQFYYLCSQLGLAVQYDPYLLEFADMLQEFAQGEESSLAHFLDYWEDAGYKRKVPTTAGVESVQAMTIHKAKGLEFPFLIFAHADFDLKSNRKVKVWREIEKPALVGGLPVAQFPLKKADADLNGALADMQTAEQSLIELDNLNLVYVAFTRAVCELHVLSCRKTSDKTYNLQNLLAEFIGEDPLPETYSIGESPEPKEFRKDSNKTVKLNLDEYQTADWREQIKSKVAAFQPEENASRDQRLSGLQWHALLSRIKYAEDIEPALAWAEKRSYLSHSEKPLWRGKIESIIQHPQLKLFFAHGLEVLNERSIIQPSGERYVPDRVVIDEKRRAHLLDYKTGQAESSHLAQLEQYRQLLAAMGYGAGENCLVYLGEELKVQRLASA